MTSARGSNTDAIARALDVFDEAEQLSLIQQAMQDPVRGEPLTVVGDSDDGQMIEPGEWREGGHVDRRTRLLLSCPVIPLGKFGEDCFFLNTLGQVHVLRASFGKGPIEGLFAGRCGWLEWAWPRWTVPRTRSEPPRVKGYEADEARMALIDACAFKDTLQIEDQVRGRGAWRGDDGGLILHAGDAV